MGTHESLGMGILQTGMYRVDSECIEVPCDLNDGRIII